MTTLIGICGGSASGKTSISKHLSKRFNCTDCVSMDNYFIVNDYQMYDSREDFLRNHNFDTLESFNVDLFVNDLKKLKNGTPIETPVYDYANSIYTGVKHIFPGKFCFVDGILLLAHPKIRSCFDIIIYVDCQKDIRYSRRLTRDLRERGATREIIEHQLKNFVMPMHDIFIEPNKIFSNLIYDNSESKNKYKFEDDMNELYNVVKRRINEKKMLEGKIDDMC